MRKAGKLFDSGTGIHHEYKVAKSGSRVKEEELALALALALQRQFPQLGGFQSSLLSQTDGFEAVSGDCKLSCRMPIFT